MTRMSFHVIGSNTIAAIESYVEGSICYVPEEALFIQVQSKLKPFLDA